jgi:hypothetical protein
MAIALLFKEEKPTETPGLPSSHASAGVGNTCRDDDGEPLSRL